MDSDYRALQTEDNRRSPSLTTTRPKVNEKRVRKKSGRLCGSKAIVVYWGLAVMCPMVLLSALLLGLVLTRSTQTSPSTSPAFNFLTNDTANSTDSYYVNMSATALLTISAWASTLTPILGVVLMELWSYRTATRIQELSQTSDKLGLPSPFQFVLLLQVLKGSITVLLQYLQYACWWDFRTIRTVPLLKTSASILSFVSLMGLINSHNLFRSCTILERRVWIVRSPSDISYSLLMLLADTWLHLTTQTVPITQSLNLAGADDDSFDRLGVSSNDKYRLKQISTMFSYADSDRDPAVAWSTQLSDQCVSAPVGRDLPCSLDTEFIAANASLSGYREVLQLLAGTSSQNKLLMIDYTNQEFVVVAPVSLPQSADFAIDFTAKTYGASTSCTPKSSECGLQLTSNQSYDWSFDCKGQGSSFKGGQNPQLGSLLYENHTLYSDNTYATAIPWNVKDQYQDRNGTHVEWFPTQNMVNPSFPAAIMVSESHAMNFTDPTSEVQAIGSVGQAMVAFCKHTIFDITYTFVNGTYSIQNATVSEQMLANITNIPIMLGHPRQYFLSKVDTIMVAQTPEAIANDFASAYSQATMAILGGVLTPSRTNSVQVRHDILVAQVFKAPLFTLITLSLLYALLGVVLMIDASRAIRKQGVADVHTRLGLAGLAAERFEEEDLLNAEAGDSTELFAEKDGADNVKVGVEQSAEGGGWRVKGFKMGKEP